MAVEAELDAVCLDGEVEGAADEHGDDDVGPEDVLELVDVLQECVYHVANVGFFLHICKIVRTFARKIHCYLGCII